MKVSRNKKSFEAITIVIETEEEAATLWHVLNCPTGVSMDKYMKQKSSYAEDGYSSETHCDLFEAFWKKYHPKSEESR